MRSSEFLNLETNVTFCDKAVEFTNLCRKMILLNINPLQNMNIGEIVSLNYNTLNWKKEEEKKDKMSMRMNENFRFIWSEKIWKLKLT